MYVGPPDTLTAPSIRTVGRRLISVCRPLFAAPLFVAQIFGIAIAKAIATVFGGSGGGVVSQREVDKIVFLSPPELAEFRIELR